jgi:hypothetical protein
MWRPSALAAFGAFVVAGACSAIETPPDTSGACGAWFDAQARLNARCGAPEVIAERLALSRSRFVEACGQRLSAPGTSKTIGSVNACAATLDTRACDAPPPGPADPCGDAPGALREGAVCFTNDQCRSGFCKNGRALPDGGPTVPTLCGVCAAALREGEPCGANDKCDGDMQCVRGQCELLQKKDPGQPCADPFNPCKPGGVCRDFVCVKAGAAGDACAVNEDCDPSLACLGQKCASRPAEGGSCDARGQCARGLGCNLETGKCERPKIVRFPAACDAETRICEIGACALAADGKKGSCPSIIPDGASCDPANKSSVCDDFALCLDGTCQIFNPSLCR